MKVKFYLKRPKAKGETVIYARYSFAGGQDKVYINAQIDPLCWNTRTGRAKRTAGFIGQSELNNYLDNCEQTMKNIHRKHLNDSNNNSIDRRKLKKEIHAALRPDMETVKNENTTLLSFCECLIRESKNGLRVNPKTAGELMFSTLKDSLRTSSLYKKNKLQRDERARERQGRVRGD
jgi:hypothetical protein